MNVSISDHFTLGKIFRFTIAPICMMIFTSLYGIVDGFFISNYAGLTEYAGVNVIMPVIMVVGGIGFMFGTGGSALTSKYLGEGKRERANQIFTMIILITLIIGILISIVGCLLIRPIAEALGSITNGTTQGMVDEAIKYGRILCLGQAFFMLQNVFQSFLVVAERQRLGFIFTVLAGVSNMFFDFLFIKVFSLGVIGAAIATIIGYVIGSVLPLSFFLTSKNANISLAKTRLELKTILKSCLNGSSEFVSNISGSIVGLVFNIQLLRYYGQNGVAAYGTLMYVSFIFVATYVGYSIGMAPIAAYNYGAQNRKELNNVLTKSLLVILSLAGIMFLAGEFLGPVFAKLYVGSSEELLALTVTAFHIFSVQFLFCGFSIYLSSFFTALNNGLVSAFISFLRTLVLEISFVFLFPLFLDGIGIWWSIPAADATVFIISFIFLFIENRRYGYFPRRNDTLTEGETK